MSDQFRIPQNNRKHDLFTPKDLISTQVDGRNYLKLYPKRNHSWNELESNLAFHINCSTLQNSSLKKNVIINSLADQMGTTTQVNVHLQQYDKIAQTQLFNPAFLSILSYHNRKGAVIEDAQEFQNGMEVLLPPHERPQGIYFVKFRCNLDFTSVGVSAKRHTYVDYYARLPITSNAAAFPVDLTKANPTDTELKILEDAFNAAEKAHTDCKDANTDPAKIALKEAVVAAKKAWDDGKAKRFQSDLDIASKARKISKLKSGANFNKASNWFTSLTSKNHLLQELSETGTHVYSLSPFLLSRPAFDSNTAEIDQKAFDNNLQGMILEVAFDPLKKVIFNYICPNLKDEPFQLFQSVCQETIDSSNPSSTTKITVEHYADIFNNLMRSLPSDSNDEWTVDVHQYFIQNLATDIREKMESDGYKDHLSSTSKLPFNQIKLLDNARRKALLAQKSLQSQASMIKSQIENTHGFFTSTENIGALYTSPAERTISHYKGSATGVQKCWGCLGEGHRWYCTKTKRVVCPHGSNPIFIKRAAEARERLRQRNAERSRKKPLMNRRGRALLQALLSEGLDGDDDDSKENDSTFNLSASQTRQENDHTSSSKRVKTTHHEAFNFFTAHVFTVQNGREALPIALHPNLPHIRLLLGESDAQFNPAIMGILDTGATLTIGYYAYILGICKAFPHLVKSIVWAKDRYSPIHLSGVVSKDLKNKNLSEIEEARLAARSTLSAVVTFHMPYFPKNNQSTSFSIAIGKDVSVNLLIGMSFIHNCQLVIDSSDSLVEAKMLDCEPFQLVYKPASRGEPNKIPQEFQPDQSVFQTYSDTLRMIDDTYSYLEGKVTDASVLEEDKVLVSSSKEQVPATAVTTKKEAVSSAKVNSPIADAKMEPTVDSKEGKKAKDTDYIEYLFN